MTIENENPLAKIKDFEEQTNKEVTFWDWLGRIAPMTILFLIVILKILSWDHALIVVLDIAVILFFIICVVWWYWAIHKIARTIRYLRESQEKFISLTSEIRKFKEAFKTDKDRI